MTLLMVLLTVAVVAGVVAVATGAVSGGLSEPPVQVPVRTLPAGPLTGQDVADLRFVQAFRGYRMDQVDAAMDGLGVEIDRLRALIDALADERSRVSGEGGPLSDDVVGQPASWSTTDFD